ncbi:ABC transporter substrate-binding protein [Paracoccus suum]|nr:ABC transporter substrate-binding protein [Paracoccus suum]
MKKWIGLVSAVSLLVVAAPVCARDAKPWRHGTVQAKGDAGFLFMAAEKDFDRKHGLDIEMVTLKGDTLLIKALIAGELDSYEGAIGSPMIAASKGADIKIIGCHWPKLSYVMWGREGIQTVADLKGKKIGVSAPGSQPDLFARALLDKEGLTEADVTVVTAGSDSERIQALAAGAIDAAPASSEFSAKAKEVGAHAVANAVDALPDAMRRCLYVTGKTLAERPEDAAAFLAAERDAYTHALANRDETTALTRKIAHLKAESPEPEAVFDEIVTLGIVSRDFKIDPAKLIWQRDLLAKLGSIDAAYDPAGMTDTAALAASGAMVGK